MEQQVLNVKSNTLWMEMQLAIGERERGGREGGREKEAASQVVLLPGWHG